jgi:hypothetical protein
LFDSSGRGHLFAFQKDTFIKEMIEQVLVGIGGATVEGKEPLRKVSLSQRELQFQDSL